MWFPFTYTRRLINLNSLHILHFNLQIFSSECPLETSKKRTFGCGLKSKKEKKETCMLHVIGCARLSFFYFYRIKGGKKCVPSLCYIAGVSFGPIWPIFQLFCTFKDNVFIFVKAILFATHILNSRTDGHV